MTSHLDKHLKTLTKNGTAKEAAIERSLATLLESYGEVLTQHQTGDGPCDIFLPARRVVVEVKERPKQGESPRCGPELAGSQPGETQFEQLQRYVRALREKEQRMLWESGAAIDLPWIGALTDGHRWWAWEWSASQTDASSTPMQLLHNRNYGGDSSGLAGALRQLATRRAGKPWVPTDPTVQFKPFRARLDDLWAQAESTKSGKTQHQLWYDLVRGSGIEVSDSRRYPLFLDHCLLVTLARYVSRVLDGDGYAPPADGFISWIASAPGGGAWARELFDKVDEFDWGSREVDVLRNVYQEMVPKADRKLYGEYYTPDWLAHLIVEETLDDEWLEAAIKAAQAEGGPPPGVGVLDPTCGSGTFLFHAARRILAAIPHVLRAGDRSAHARLTSWLVHGIDIHPVAVEMARATLRRALPAPVEVSVHQGDALLMADTETAGLTGRLFDAETSEFRAPDGQRSFHIPHSFVDRADFAQRLDDLVNAARNGLSLPRNVSDGLPGDDIEWLQDAHETLTEIVKEHGDGVWSWYIRNQVMPRALARRKVNRIVSNPPWLRWSEIQTEPRKGDFKSKAKHRQIFPLSGRYHTGFDVAAVFVVECRELYLNSPTGDPSVFLLNAAVAKSENWRQFRVQGFAQGLLDLAGCYADGLILKPRPFSGADCCAIGIRQEEKLRLVLSNERVRLDASAMNPPHKAIRYAPALVEPSWSSSPYALRARNGATIFPAVLTRVDPDRPDWTLQPRKAKDPWRQFDPFPLSNVPEHWRLTYLESQHLHPFAVAPTIGVAVIPSDGVKLLDDVEARSISMQWRRLSDVYRANHAAGSPNDLIANVNYSGKLGSQLPPSMSVVYNASGSSLRAAVVQEVIEHKLYRVAVETLEEGDYLCSILNAPPLQVCYRLARKSGRDFDKTPLEKIPIPLYNPTNPDHQTLAAVGGAIREARAAQPELPYPQAFQGHLEIISEIVRRLLPDYCIEPEDLR